MQPTMLEHLSRKKRTPIEWLKPTKLLHITGGKVNINMNQYNKIKSVIMKGGNEFAKKIQFGEY